MAKVDPRAFLLCQIPGIGYYSALLIIAEIGDITRFPDERHLCAYAGVTPSVHSSGGRRYYGHITRQGSGWLRWITVEAAQMAGASPNNPYYRLYKKMVRRKGRGTAKVAVAGTKFRPFGKPMLPYGNTGILPRV